MREKVLTLFVFLMGVFSYSLLAQTSSVKGVVTDSEGVPLPGVSVVIKNSNRGISTDFDGNFEIRAEQGDILVFSSLGFATQEKVVGKDKSKTMKVVLMEEAQAIEEVVVVAYGTAKKQSLVGAQSTVSAKQLEMRPITNITSALSGMATGVQTTLSGGQPGTSSTIRIRGIGSVNAGNDPIYVVDGSIYNGNISSISVQDIESISVLKDAASTSLYGSSAGNGVVLITTKSGSKTKGKNPVVTYSNSIGFSTRGQEDYEKVGVMDHYRLRWQQWFNDYKYSQKFNDSQAAGAASKDVLEDLRYQPYAGIKSVYEFDNNTNQWSLTSNPSAGNETYLAIVMPDGSLNPEITGLLWEDDLDWEKHLFKTGIRNEHSVSVGHNTDKVKTYLSTGYIRDEGYRIKTFFERFSGRANINYDVNNWLSLGTNTSYSKVSREQPRTTGANTSNVFSFIRTIAPIYPIHRHNEDGSYVLDDKGNKLYDYNRERPFRGNYNPIYEADLDLYSTDEDAMTSRTFAEFRFLPELKLRLNYSYDVLRYTTKMRYNNILGAQPEGLLEVSNYKTATTTFNQLLDYKKEFGKHDLSVLLGHESYEYKYIYSSADKKGVSFAGVDEFPNYSTLGTITSRTDKYTKEGYFGRVSYGFDKRYDVSASYRRDGSSRFHPDNRWGNFWSVGAGWNLKREFLDNISLVNNLKLRASYGKTGNDSTIDRNERQRYYPYQTTYSYSNNNTIPGLRISTYGNPHLVWEKQVSTDIALEFGLFNHLRGTVEWFSKESDDLIFEYPLPSSTGIASVDRNIGKMRNSGLEIDLTLDIFKTNDFKWSFNANGTILKNKVVSLPEHNRANGIVYNSIYKRMEGHSIYDYYVEDWIGVNPKDGLAMYRLDSETFPDQANPNSPNFRGIEKEGELASYTNDINFAKKHFAGSAIPDLYGGFGTNLQWKGFDLGVQFAYQLGGYAYDEAYRLIMGRSLNTGTAMHIDLYNAWKKPGDITDVPRLDAGTQGQYANSDSDRFLISRTALMLKNVSLSYTFPSEVVNKLNVNNIRVGISGENLFLWSKRKGLNPMSSLNGLTANTGYHFAKIVTCNLSVSF